MAKHRVKRKFLSVGDTILGGKYEILKVIHTSGMANVYLVSDKNLNKQWCLKEIVKSEAGRNMVEYRSLLQEANIMKKLNHSSIPRIVTIEEEGDSVFIIMDYVDGISLSTWIVTKVRIDQEVAVNWMIQLCGVMMYLHNQKNPIFYRDMKPENVMIQSDGNIKLLDFGISVIITPEDNVIKETLGTKGFAAPEQKIQGAKYDLRSDIFALGRTFYYMLTALNPSVIEKRIAPVREIDPNISIGLEKIINKCTQENPDDRYQTIEELLYALQNYNKLDSNYKKKVKRKVRITLSLFIISFLLIICSFIPYGLDIAENNNIYKEKVEVAYQTGRFSDFIDALSLKPTNLSPYIGMIDSVKQDGSYTKQEEKQLLNLINPCLSSIKDDEKYGEVAYNIGKLYWFYYEGDDGDTVSSKWFKESMDAGYEVEQSKVYYDLGNFKKSISMSIAESSDAGKYIEYWNNLKVAKGIDTGEIVELQLYNAIADTIDSYAYRLRTDGVSREDIQVEINNIQEYLKSTKPSQGRAEELYTFLSEKVGTLNEKVKVAYSQNGGTN